MAVLLPPLVRSRLEGNPVASIGRFRRNLRILQSTSPAASSLSVDPEGRYGHLPATWAREARRLSHLRRRRRLAQFLVGAMGTTLVLGLAFRPLLYVHVLVDLVFFSYIAMLVQARRLKIQGIQRQRRVAARLEAEALAVAEEEAAQASVLRQQAL